VEPVELVTESQNLAQRRTGSKPEFVNPFSKPKSGGALAGAAGNPFALGSSKAQLSEHPKTQASAPVNRLGFGLSGLPRSSLSLASSSAKQQLRTQFKQ